MQPDAPQQPIEPDVPTLPVPEPPKLKKRPLWVKIILAIVIIIGIFIILTILRGIISRTSDIRAFNKEYSSAVEKCGGAPLIKVSVYGWKVGKREIMTPQNTAYDWYIKSSRSYFGELFTSFDINAYYCSLEEAGINLATGENTSGVDFYSYSNLTAEHQLELSKQYIKAYESTNKVKFFQPAYLPATYSKSNISVFRQSKSTEGENSTFYYPYHMYYGTAEDTFVSVGDVEFKCKAYSFTPTMQQITDAKNFASESQRYYPIEISNTESNSLRQWTAIYIPIDRNFNDSKEDLESVKCEMTDYESKVSLEDSKRMLNELKRLDINSFSKVTYYSE